MITNRQIAAVLFQMAQILDILGEDSFRAAAYNRAARAVEEHGEELAATEPPLDAAGLCTIPGIGKGMATRIAELIARGQLDEHNELLGQIPPTLLDLLGVPGLGPKGIAVLWRQGGVTSLDDLKAKLESGALAGLPGYGPKKLANLQKNLAFAQTSEQRIRIGRALPLALWFVQHLRQLPGVQRIEYAGSLRRGRETIGDIDLIAAAGSPEAAAALSDAFAASELTGEVLLKGPTKTSIRTRADVTGGHAVQVDLRVVEPAQFGAALLYFTGSKEHNVALRQRAIDRGMRLNEYALAREGQVVAAASEQDIYEALDLAWVAPEMREGRGELGPAEQRTLPALVELRHIRAELHAHTTASDGRWSIRELAAAAAERGFHTIAVTDHSRSQTIAGGLSEERLEAHIREVRRVADELAGTIRVLAGSEVDILADGRLDYPDSLLRELDIVVASPHAALAQDTDKATTRLLKAIENRYVTILGHPTGRLINRRAGLEPDMKRVIAAAAQRGIAMEINANSHRLDLRDMHARMAIEAGVKLAINTDAHGPADLDQLLYGILTARRAGATPADVVNCMDQAGLATWITSTRRE